MKLFHFLLPEPTLMRLRAHAERADLTVSQIIRHAIAQYLKQYEGNHRHPSEDPPLTGQEEKQRVKGLG